MAVEASYDTALPLFRPKAAPLRFGRAWAVTLFVADLLALIAATVAATHVVQDHWHAGLAFDRVVLAQAVCATAWLFVFYRVGLYHRSFALSVRDEIYCTVTALFVGALPLLILFTIVPAISSSRAVLLVSIAFASLGVGLERAILRFIYARTVNVRGKRIVFAGNRERVEQAMEQMHISSRAVVRKIVVDDVEETLTGIETLTGRAIDNVPWLRSARDGGCDLLVLTEMLPPRVMPPLLQTAALERFKVAFAPPRIRSQAYDLRMETDGQQALIVMTQLRTLTHGARILKRAFDMVVAGAILVFVAPIIAIFALAVILEDRGPAFFLQERVGLFGKPFKIIKLRSMRVDAEQQSGAIWSPKNDPRTTRVGRFVRRTSIDELPQFFNVLRGDMSIVGPRPERMVFVEQFRREFPRYDERLLVRPGITGWSHVNMPRKVDPSAAAERLSHDLWYVEHWNLFMDVSIILKTAAEFLFQRQ